MPDLGQLLHDTMARHQDDAPSVDGLLAGARARRRRRQTLLAAGPVTAVVAASVIATVVVVGGGGATPRSGHPVMPSLAGQGALDDRLFEVQAPTLSPIIGGLGPQPRDPCPRADIDAHGELRRTFDGVVGAVVLETTKACSIFVAGTPSLVNASGHQLHVPYVNPEPTSAEFTKHGMQADFNGGEGRFGFAWRGSWCGATAAALQLPLSMTPHPDPSPGPTLRVPLSGPSPVCDGSSDSTLVPGTVHGVGWPMQPMDSGVLPGQPSWAALSARVTLDSLTLAEVRVSVTLQNPTDDEIVLQPCPRFTVAIYYGYGDGSFEPEHDALFPCDAGAVIPAHGERSYGLPALPASGTEDARTPTKRVLFFAFADLHPVRVDVPTP